MKIFISTAVFVASLIATPALAAVSFTSIAGNNTNYQGTAGATVNMTFNQQAGTVAEASSKGLIATLTGSSTRSEVVGSGQTNNLTNNYTVYSPVPYDNNGYFTVGGDGSLELSSASNQNYSSISVFIGSIDAYNSINLYDQTGAFIRSFSGTQLNNDVIPVYPGDGTQGGSRFVTFTGTNGTLLSKIRFYNTGNQSAFEFDNVSFQAAVPEPATWAMMLVGFCMIGAVARRSKAAAKITFA